MRGQVDLAKGAFANQAAKGIVADGFEVGAREFAAESWHVSQERGPRETQVWRWEMGEHSLQELLVGSRKLKHQLLLATSPCFPFRPPSQLE